MEGKTVSGLVVGAALALVVAIALAVFMIGAETLRTLGVIFVVGLALALVVGASALPIRAYRRKDQTGETHYVHDGTKTIVRETRILDGRAIEAPKLYQLPAQAQAGAFPELLRAAFSAGALGSRSETAVDAEVRELAPDEWTGDIR
jgi:hypothetical protein